MDRFVYVVVFEGPVRTTVTGPRGLEVVALSNVVCVYKPPSEMFPEGEPLIYYDVPLDDFVR